MKHRAHPRWAALLVAAIGLTTGGEAFAESVGASPLRPGDRGFLAFSSVFTASPSGDEVATVQVAPQLSAGVRFGRSWIVTLDLAAAFTTYRVYGEERRDVFRMGNPLVAVHYALRDDARGSLRVGLGVGPPLVTVPGTLPTNVAAAYADTVAAEARGFQGYWLWARNAAPLFLLASGSVNVGSRVVLGGEIQPGLLVSVNSAPSRAALVGNASFGYRLGRFQPGIRGQLFWSSVPIAAHDFAQLSLAPFVRLDLDRSFFRAELVVNLDGPYGLAGSRGATVWGASAGGGLRF